MEGLQGILYRLKMIYYLAYSMEKPSRNKIEIASDKNPGVSFAVTRAPLESLLVHIRALNEFLIKLESKNPKEDDLRACCYLGINEAKEFRKRMEVFLLGTNELNAINKQLSHITTSEEIISKWDEKIPSMRDRFFHIFHEFIIIRVINESIKTVDRWNDPKYREIRNHLENPIIDQNDIKILDNDTFYKSTIEKYNSVASLASSTGATPINLNSDQKSKDIDIQKIKIQSHNKE